MRTTSDVENSKNQHLYHICIIFSHANFPSHHNVSRSRHLDAWAYLYSIPYLGWQLASHVTSIHCIRRVDVLLYTCTLHSALHWSTSRDPP